jgi:two-component system, chemotaxis family, sensor kinase CheA
MAELGGGGGGGPIGRGDSPGDKAREEFFSEAQELVDGLGRDLLALDEVVKRGGSDSELINDIFRAVHTLKGIAGLFGANRMTGLSHELEDVLDDLRLGRIDVTARVLDLLFQAVELYGRILAAEKGDLPEPSAEVEALLVAFGQLSQHRGGGGAGLVAQYDLDPGLLGVLTEYEEHRLRTNIQAGLGLYRIRVRFSLATIDSALDDLKAKARPHGEIITYLPTGAGGDIESIELEILMSSQASLDTLTIAIAAPNISIEEVRRRTARSVDAPAFTPPPPLAVPRGMGIPRIDDEPYPRDSIPAESAALRAEVQAVPNAFGSRADAGGAARTPLPPAPAASTPPAGGVGGRELSMRSVVLTFANLTIS